jgi:glutaredoxin 3
VLELFGSASCPYTPELREQLEWSGRVFVEYDVDADADARTRLLAMTPSAAVPTLVEDGTVLEVGWHGRSCYVGSAPPPA